MIFFCWFGVVTSVVGAVSFVLDMHPLGIEGHPLDQYAEAKLIPVNSIGENVVVLDRTPKHEMLSALGERSVKIMPDDARQPKVRWSSFRRYNVASVGAENAVGEVWRQIAGNRISAKTHLNVPSLGLPEIFNLNSRLNTINAVSFGIDDRPHRWLDVQRSALRQYQTVFRNLVGLSTLPQRGQNEQDADKREQCTSPAYVVADLGGIRGIFRRDSRAPLSAKIGGVVIGCLIAAGIVYAGVWTISIGRGRNIDLRGWSLLGVGLILWAALIWWICGA